MTGRMTVLPKSCRDLYGGTGILPVILSGHVAPGQVNTHVDSYNLLLIYFLTAFI